LGSCEASRAECRDRLAPLEAGLRHENELMALAFAQGNAEADITKFNAREKT
jgi:hypothetical protein